MNDLTLAGILYILVHDFQEEIITEARAQMRHSYPPPTYRSLVETIVEWARAGKYTTILRHAERTLELIDAPTFDPLTDI